MQSQDLETVTSAEPNEHIDAHERQLYQAPCLVRLDLAATEAGPAGIYDGSTFS